MPPDRRLFITIVIAAVGWFSALATCGFALAGERGETQEVIRSNVRRITALEQAVKSLPVIQRDVEWIRESMEKRTTP